jgi:hypothetical protein
MDGLTLDEFEKQVIASCANSPIVASVSVTGIGVTWLRLRAYLIEGSFLEAFYNEITGKTSFALIQNDQRIFGADNNGGWHWHPFETPNEHIPAKERIDFLSFLNQVQEHLKSYL